MHTVHSTLMAVHGICTMEDINKCSELRTESDGLSAVICNCWKHK